MQRQNPSDRVGEQLARVIPISQLRQRIPLFGGVTAGFPSPAEDYAEDRLDIAAYIVRNPSTTFFVRVEGHSMTGDGIFPNDILVVDRSLRATSGSVIVAYLHGEFTVKRLIKDIGCWSLVPSHPDYTPIVVTEDDDFLIWGVVSFVIHKP